MSPEERKAVGATLRALAPLTEASLNPALDEFEVRTLEPGEQFLHAGDRAHLIGFVARGLLREYYVSSDGTERTRSFSTEGQFTGSLYDLLSGQGALVGVEALEPSRLLVTEWAAFETRCEREATWQIVRRRFTESLYMRKSVREHQMLALSAKERWEAFLREDESLVARISGRHLASYLGITPEHLSRIRSAARAPAKRTRKRR